MNINNDDEDIEQKNISTYKILGEEMANLAINYKKMKNNENNPSNDNINKGKMKNQRGTKASISWNKADIKINNRKNINSVNEPYSNQQNSLNNSKNNNINNVKNNSINNINNPTSVTYPFQIENNNQNDTSNKNPIEPESLSNENQDMLNEELIEIENINPEDLKDMSDDSINPFIFEKNFVKKSRQHDIYERSMIYLKKRKTKLKKKQEFYLNQETKDLKKKPGMNERSIILSQGEYIPIENRAAKLHSKRLTQIILNEEVNKLKQREKEEKEMSEKINTRNYSPREWNEFVERCFKWKKELLYKRKAEEIKNNMQDIKINYKPRINENSKKIMRKIMNKGNTSVDDVFTRLYNDYEEHKERQQDLENKNKPSFNPIVNNSKFNKNLYQKKPYRNKSYDNSYENFVTDESKSNFFLESQITINDGKLRKKKKRALRFVNKNKSDINKKTLEENINYNRSYKPTQATNHTTLYMNTDNNMNNKIKFKKYMNTENNYMNTESHLMTNQNYLPTDINIFSDENRIIDELNENNNSLSYKKNKNKNYLDNMGEYDDINNQSNNQSNNQNSSNRELNYEDRILKELDEAKIKNKERLEKNMNNEESKNNDNSLYKINVMETTPDNEKQNVIIPSNKYQDFFDIEEISEL
jgi:hypothetical protein